MSLCIKTAVFTCMIKIVYRS